MACLDSVAPFRARTQIIVVDDASTDTSREIAARYECQLICLETNRGAAAARNIGARAARGDILFFLDSDIAMRRDTIDRLLQVFAADPLVTALFGSYQKDTVPTNFVSVYKNLLHHYTHQNSSPEAATFCSGFGAVRRGVFLAMGGFDERQRALEDIEFGYRLHKAGYTVRLVKDLQFTHLKTYSLASLVISDVRDRAIPWTRLMLEQNIFRNDLNTKSNNVASVLLAHMMLATPLWIWFVPLGIWVLGAVLLAFFVLNADFIAFVTRERGVWFGIRALAMTWFNYVYSGVGLLLGIVTFGWSKLPHTRV